MEPEKQNPKTKKKRKLKPFWKRAMAVACFGVVFCTTYSLILPAITASVSQKVLNCEKEEHTHTISCYTSVPDFSQYNCNPIDEANEAMYELLGRDMEERFSSILDVNVADEDSEDLLTIKYIVHEHNEYCYDDEGNLICMLDEVAEHSHDSTCYCYEFNEDGTEEKILTCTQPEITVHVHDEECLDGDGNLICGKPLVIEHNHSLSCFDTYEVLLCGCEEHQHTDDCYTLIESEVEGISPLTTTNGTAANINKGLTSNIDETIIYDNSTESIYSDPINSNSDMKAESNGEPSAQSDSNPEFHVNVIDVKYINPDGDESDFGNGQDVMLGGSLDIYLSYNIDPGYFSGNNTDSVQYQLLNGSNPGNLKLAQEESGPINVGGVQVGEYTISSTGLITLKYYESYVELNKTTALDGTITVSASANDLSNASSDKDHVSIVVAGTTITFTAVDGDIDVSKTGTALKDETDSYETGEITYTITIESKKGTGNEVTLTDVMENIGVTDLSSVVVQLNEETLDSSKYSLWPTDNGFSGTLPQMNAEDIYTITYTGKTVFTDGSSKRTNNIATATSTLINSNQNVSDSDNHEYTFNKNPISKSGSYDANTKKITWTITVNADRSISDLTGWKISDLLNGSQLSSEIQVTVKDSDGNIKQKDVSISEVQMSGQGPYTITYETDNTVIYGQTKTMNKATLYKEDDTSKSYDSNTVYAGADNLVTSPISKEYNSSKNVSYTILENGDTATVVSWTMKLDTTSFSLPNPLKINDELWAGQWFTTDQIKELIYNFIQALKVADSSITENDISIELYAKKDGDEIYKDEYADPKVYYASNFFNVSSPEDILIQISGNTNVTDKIFKGYGITINKSITLSSPMSFTYSSTVPTGNIGTDESNIYVSYSNSANIDGNYTTSPSSGDLKTTKFRVYKFDAVNTGGGSETYHTWDDVEENGLSWKVRAVFPAQYENSADSIIICEELPDGTELNKLNIILKTKAWGEYSVSLNDNEIESLLDETTITQTISKVVTSYNENGQEIKTTYIYQLKISYDADKNSIYITVPPEVWTDYDTRFLQLDIGVDVLDSIETHLNLDGENEATAANTVSLFLNNSEEASATQTQIINPEGKKSASTKPTETLEKTVGEFNESSNTLTYIVTFNPDAEDLNEDGNTITLKDVMHFTYQKSASGVLNATLISATAYEILEDGTKRELTSAEFSYKYAEDRSSSDDWANMYNTIEFNVPNNMYVSIIYTYWLTGTIGNTIQIESNKIEYDVYTSSISRKDYIIQNSRVTVEANGFTIYKVDQDNMALGGLAGARFDLYYWQPESENSDTGQWVLDKDDITTNTLGKYVVNGLNRNLAYKLVETEAPTGYLKSEDPIYFYLYSSDGSLIAPANWSGRALNGGETLPIGNESNTTSLIVTKKWEDSEGNETSALTDSISVSVQQEIISYENPITGSINVEVGFLNLANFEQCN